MTTIIPLSLYAELHYGIKPRGNVIIAEVVCPSCNGVSYDDDNSRWCDTCRCLGVVEVDVTVEYQKLRMTEEARLYKWQIRNGGAKL